MLSGSLLACQGRPLDDGAGPATTSAEDEESFLAIARAQTGDVSDLRKRMVLAPMGAVDPEHTFYLAIHKRELGKRWFLSAYLKQFFPDAVLAGAAETLGTRVVSFKIQNGKLFVFDVDDRKHDSDVFDNPDVIVDAYPIVEGKELQGGRSLDNYVVVDPAAGLNHFGVVSDAFAAGFFSPPDRFQVELAFSQNFRALPDGAVFEQAFTGYSETARDTSGIDRNPFHAAGVLGLALRRYQEGEGYKPTQLPLQEMYFRSDPKLAPNGEVDQVAIKWNVHPGSPIRWLISPVAQQLQDSPDLKAANIDLVGAIKAGIESWNVAFGFQALQAELASPDDSFADDDKNYLIYDVNDSVGFAFADWRNNPNTGEVRGASVYFNHGFVTDALDIFPDPNAPAAAPAEPREPREQKARPTLVWDAFPRQPRCTLVPNSADVSGLDLGPGEPMTRKEKIEKRIAHVIAHEIGHTLGLRHNFKGTLVPPTASVMDYIPAQVAILAPVPAPYDIAAIRFLYDIDTAAPDQPFCTDDALVLDPDCNLFDVTDDPLRKFYGPGYLTGADRLLTTGAAPRVDLNLAHVVSYARRSPNPARRLEALGVVLAPVKTPIDPAKVAAHPDTYAPVANALVQRIVARLVPGPMPLPEQPDVPETVPPRPLDATVSAQLAAELGTNVVNADGIRSFATRRICVDALKRLQTLSAYEALLGSRSVLKDSPPPTSVDEQALLADLLARIEQAITPYFN